MALPKFKLPNLPEDMAAHDGAGAESVTTTSTDPFHGYVHVADPDGNGFAVFQNRRKTDERRSAARRKEDKEAIMADYVERLERNREIVARGWAMFAMGFSSGVVMILAFMYLTS